MFAKGLDRTFKDVKSGVQHWRVWSYLAWREIRLRYRRSILGPVWMVGSMAATALSLSILMGAIMDRPIHEFLPYTMTGLLVWSMVSLPLSEGPDLFLINAGTISNNNFPYSLYAMGFVWKTLIVTAHNFVALLAIYVATGSTNWPIWQVLPGMVIVTLFMVTLAPVAGLAAARFRDLRFMLPQFAQLMFFLTPIFWRVDNVPANRSAIYEYNPLYYILAVVRDPLVGEPVDLKIWLVALGIVAFTTVLYLIVFASFRQRLPFWI